MSTYRESPPSVLHPAVNQAKIPTGKVCWMYGQDGQPCGQPAQYDWLVDEMLVCQLCLACAKIFIDGLANGRYPRVRGETIPPERTRIQSIGEA